jgi:hypothetical protein
MFGVDAEAVVGVGVGAGGRTGGGMRAVVEVAGI